MPDAPLVRALAQLTATRTDNTLGQLIRITDATTAATLLDESYAYDAAGNPVSISRPDGTDDTFSYDTLNRLTKACYTTACATSTEALEWSYDHAGNILTENRNGQTTTHSCNTKGQRTQTVDPVTGTTGYSYDYRGQTLTARTRPSPTPRGAASGAMVGRPWRAPHATGELSGQKEPDDKQDH